MKKGFVTFCAFVLLATQAPEAGATTIDKEEKRVRIEQSLNLYKGYWQGTFSINIGNLDFIKHNIDELKLESFIKHDGKVEVENQEQVKAKAEAEAKAKAEAEAKAKAEAEAKAKAEAEAKAKAEAEEKAKAEAEAKAKAEANSNSSNTGNNATNSKPTNSTTVTQASTVSAFELKVVELTNQERQKAGLAPLSADTPLMNAAREKSQNMKDYNYFSHTSPNLGSPFDRLNALGISYRSAGENIAKGQSTPEEVVKAWMNSQGHRANILNDQYTHIGVGYVKDGHIWTQQFIQK
ncbi:CAP domain-containing protein [Lysinibacillus sp. 54212]|uniref:CAP domain-containing protein n=1 Tax=Lysinibacillus sp. 54212 TaxID=3119829 RepID=UPI002FC6E573